MVDIELIGFLGGAIVAVSLLPQVFKSWKTKSTKDISLPWTIIYFSGLLLWVAYGIGIASAPITLMMSVEALLAGSPLFLKLRHG